MEDKKELSKHQGLFRRQVAPQIIGRLKETPSQAERSGSQTQSLTHKRWVEQQEIELLNTNAMLAARKDISDSSNTKGVDQATQHTAAQQQANALEVDSEHKLSFRGTLDEISRGNLMGTLIHVPERESRNAEPHAVWAARQEGELSGGNAIFLHQ